MSNKKTKAPVKTSFEFPKLNFENTKDGELERKQIVEFCEALKRYQVHCEKKGDYIEAEKAMNQLQRLTKRIKKEENKVVQGRKERKMQLLKHQQQLQLVEFNEAWSKFFREYDELSEKHLNHMKQTHELEIKDLKRDFKQKAKKEQISSKELIEWRRRQELVAKTKNYIEAEKLKKVADIIETKENLKFREDVGDRIDFRLKAMKNKHSCQLFALTKRIKMRRAEHLAKQKSDLSQIELRHKKATATLKKKLLKATPKFNF